MARKAELAFQIDSFRFEATLASDKGEPQRLPLLDLDATPEFRDTFIEHAHLRLVVTGPCINGGNKLRSGTVELLFLSPYSVGPAGAIGGGNITKGALHAYVSVNARHIAMTATLLLSRHWNVIILTLERQPRQRQFTIMSIAFQPDIDPEMLSGWF